jgi:transposase
MTKYTIILSKEEVEELTAIIKRGKHTSQSFRSAYVLLNCDKGEYSQDSTITNAEITKILKIGDRTIDRIKKKFLEEGFEGVLDRRPSSQNYTKKMDGDLEAKLVTLCCSEPPAGYSKWSLRLLADKLVELNYVDSISHVSVRRALKKTNLSRGKSKVG